MAENKYDLLLIPTKDTSRVKHQPWYRERLNAKYSKPSNKKDWKPKLTAASWTFIKDGLDDFRDGKPPQISDVNLLIKGSKGLEPNLYGVDLDSKPQPKEKIAKKFPRDEAVYQKQLPLQGRRRTKVEEMEKSLLDHPLALFSHLEESVPPELFEDIVNLLDPAMNLEPEGSASSQSSPVSRNDNVPSLSDHVFEESEVKSSHSRYTGHRDTLESVKRNPYRWLPDLGANREDRSKTSEKRQDSPTQETSIDKVTKEFCDWVRELGEGSNNIEESTIYSLFASGYETKPALSVPIHVVELTNVPPELRSGNVGPQNDNSKQKKEILNNRDSKYTPSWVKKYQAAWYLDPKKWTLRAANEQLQDPKENKEMKMSESKKKSKDLDKVLATLHGARAFKDFVGTKKTRTPEFLESVAQHQEAIAAAEAKRLDEDAKTHPVHPSSRSASRRHAQSPKSRTNTFD